MRVTHVLEKHHYELHMHEAELDVMILALKFMESAYTLGPNKASIAKGIRLQIEGSKQ